jgi:gamma-glutamylcyclotransferase (GGCT)/AIG2-like uncharacterized protein YtfP
MSIKRLRTEFLVDIFMNERTEIDNNLAKRILAACYVIDAQLRHIEESALDSLDEPNSKNIKQLFSELTTLIGAEIMVPIYMEHPELGRVMEPGDWLSKQTHKFGFREH